MAHFDVTVSGKCANQQRGQIFYERFLFYVWGPPIRLLILYVPTY